LLACIRTERLSCELADVKLSCAVEWENGN
jgi:hypothetical protein